MSSRPLVPSKDALQVLRRLAYSPPAAFVGAAGALCGVATVQYYERRKVRRAEAILETKRTLHTLTKGRGSARLALMFEAAERGEDFTINKSRRSRSFKRRRLSALAAPRENGDTATWKDATHVHSHTPLNSEARRNTSENAIDDTVNQLADNTAQVNQSEAGETAIWKPFVYDKDKPLDERRSDELDDEINPVCHIYKSPGAPLEVAKTYKNIHTWSTLQKHAVTHIGRLPEAISDILGEAYSSVEQPLSKISTRQPLTDLKPLAQASAKARSSSHERWQVGATSKGSSILMQLDPITTFATSTFGALQPWQDPPTAQKDVATSQHTNQDLVRDDKSYPYSVVDESDLYVALSTPVPAFMANTRFQSRYNLDNPKVRTGMNKVGVDRYEYVFTCLTNCVQEHGTEAALALLERVMVRYTTTRKLADFTLIQALFLDCTKLFTTDELKPIVWRYVEKFLAGDAPRLEAVSLLYPRCGAGVRSTEQHYYFLAHQYLEQIREKGYSLDRQMTELRKVLAGTRLYNIELHEHLVIPVLRSLCSTGRMTSAQALIDEMKEVHKINTTPYSLQILIKGYARIGNWYRVKVILDDFHHSELSQYKPYGLSGLLISIVKDFSYSQPPERAVKFVLRALKLYKVQPVSTLTREMICLCLRHRRYDLVVSWIIMVKTEFPYIELGTDSSTFAYDVSRVWRDIDASIEDILNGCRAIATHALRDPFSKVFRSVIAEATTRYLDAQLAELRKEIGPEVPRHVSGKAHNVHASLKSLKDSPATRKHGSRARLLLAHVLKEGAALRWLDALCRGHLQSAGTSPRLIVFKSEDQTERGSKKIINYSTLKELRDNLLQNYVQEEKAGHVIEHNRLRELVNQLIEQDRAVHAFELIQSVYDSRWVQAPAGREFDIELFTDWLQLAWELKSGSRVRSVLWALVDASPQLRLSSQIILLARIAAPKTHLQKVKRAKTYQVDEVEYLRMRLKRRRWATTHNEKGLVLSEWSGTRASSDAESDYE